MRTLLTFILLTFSFTCFASNVLIYDPTTGRAKAYLKSVNTPSYSSRKDVVINPVLPKAPLKYLKVKDGKVVEMTQIERDALLVKEQQAIKEARIKAISNLDISAKDVITALIKVINKRIPNNPITKDEIITQIKQDKGL